MKQIFISLLMVALCGYAIAQSSSETPYLTRSFSGASIRNAEVETSGGGIQVTGVDPSQARVEVYISGNGIHSLSWARASTSPWTRIRSKPATWVPSMASAKRTT